MDVKKALTKSKIKKAVGIDNLPNEILKSNNTLCMLHIFLAKVFDSGIMPKLWKTAIIKPLPKSSTIDPRLPLQYRGVSLLSTVYKIFSSILNRRISDAAESNGLIVDEQNGFRRERSCEDHIYSLTTVIRNRKMQGLSTYTAFIDMEKAFDRVDRSLLLWKLLNMGINGKIYECVRNIYVNSNACLNLNGHLSEKFSTDFGVKQGDCLSPTLFSLFTTKYIIG